MESEAPAAPALPAALPEAPAPALPEAPAPALPEVPAPALLAALPVFPLDAVFPQYAPQENSTSQEAVLETQAVLDTGIWIVEGTDDLDESGVRHIILNGRTTMCEQFEDIDYA